MSHNKKRYPTTAMPINNNIKTQQYMKFFFFLCFIAMNPNVGKYKNNIKNIEILAECEIKKSNHNPTKGSMRSPIPMIKLLNCFFCLCNVASPLNSLCFTRGGASTPPLVDYFKI